MTILPGPIIKGDSDFFTDFVAAPDLEEGIEVGVAVIRAEAGYGLPVEIQHAPSVGGSPSTGDGQFIAILRPGETKLRYSGRRLKAGRINWFRGRHRTPQNTGPWTNWVGAVPVVASAAADVPTTVVPKGVTVGSTSFTSDARFLRKVRVRAGTTGDRAELDSVGGSGRLRLYSTGGTALAVVYVSTGQGNFVSDGIARLAGGTGIKIDAVTGDVVLSNLPTSDPGVADALWNDSGTIRQSTG